MTLKRTKVVMLPTNQKANLSLDKYNSLFYGNYPKDDSLNQNLYFLSDEEIKEGDWYIDDTNSVRQSITSNEDYWTVRKDYRKIIATTDESLLFVKKLPSNENINLQKVTRLPQPSQSFLEKYVEAYNKGKQVKEVMVEYEWSPESKTLEELDRKLNRILYCSESSDNPYKLKIDLKNTITIRPIKDSFTLSEMKLAFLAGKEHAPLEGEGDIYFNKWIEQNL